MSACRSLKALMRDRVEIPSVLDVWLHGLTSDSRRVRPGMAFVALAGGSADPWDNLNDAIHRGAPVVLLESQHSGSPYEYRDAVIVPVESLGTMVADLADDFFGHPSASVSVIGVTGTNGKSSVTSFLGQILNRCGTPTASMGTLGYGLAGALEHASHTTPDVTRVHELLARFRHQGAQAVVMEVSSHALDQGRVDRVRFAGAVFTNLSREHLDYHGSMSAYEASKARLFEAFEPEFAVINVDDHFGERLAGRLNDDVRLLRYGTAGAARELRIKDVRAGHDGIEARVETPMGELLLQTGLMGSFNISNMTAAAAAALALGVPVAGVSAAAVRVTGAPGRLETFKAGNGCLVVIDYAHTEDALGTVLEALRPHTAGRLWCVFGCGGNRDTAKRPAMGAVAARLADRVILTDDNSRHEAPERIIDEILSGMENSDGVTVMPDRRMAIEFALKQGVLGDTVLIAGKGHERIQERAGEWIPFSDVDVVRQLLDEEGDAA